MLSRIHFLGPSGRGRVWWGVGFMVRVMVPQKHVKTLRKVGVAEKRETLFHEKHAKTVRKVGVAENGHTK